MKYANLTPSIQPAPRPLTPGSFCEGRPAQDTGAFHPFTR